MSHYTPQASALRACIATLIAMLALPALVSSKLMAQDPKVDLPSARSVMHFIEADLERSRLAQVFYLAAAGWTWEAQRAARELGLEDPALGQLALAIASWNDQPERAVRFARKARRLEGDDGFRASVLDAYVRHFERAAEAAAGSAARTADRELRRGLTAALRGFVGGGDAASATLAAGLLASGGAALPTRAAAGTLPKAKLGLADAVDLTGGHAEMPFVLASGAAAGASARLPLHPDWGVAAAVRAAVPASASLPAQAPSSEASLAWKPRTAPAFDLVRGLDQQRRRFVPGSGKPTLVVFFLGFGCVHCVAQLKQLDPVAPRFEAAGIDVITIGTDGVDQVRAARQTALENGVDPLHMDVLCDPEGASFKAWGAWDRFADEALHGSFLVDGKGRILWQDISERPFVDVDFLLAESARLLAAWAE